MKCGVRYRPRANPTFPLSMSMFQYNLVYILSFNFTSPSGDVKQGWKSAIVCKTVLQVMQLPTGLFFVCLSTLLGRRALTRSVMHTRLLIKMLLTNLKSRPGKYPRKFPGF